MSTKRLKAHRWGLGLKNDELDLIGSGATEIDLTRSRMPLLSVGDTIKLVDWDTEQECSAEILKKLEICSYRIRIAGEFEPIVRNLKNQSLPDRRTA